MSRFEVGQTVRSLVAAQGLAVGEELRVAEVEVLETRFGGFTTLLLERADGSQVAVRNGHLVLEVLQ